MRRARGQSERLLRLAKAIASEAARRRTELTNVIRTVYAVEGLLQELEQRHRGYRFHLTGPVVVAACSIYEIINDLGRSLTPAGTLIFVLMTIVFRSWTLGHLSVVLNIFPQALTAAVLVGLHQSLMLTTVMTFSLCLGLSVDDTVHFLMRFKQHRHGTDRGEIARSPRNPWQVARSVGRFVDRRTAFFAPPRAFRKRRKEIPARRRLSFTT